MAFDSLEALFEDTLRDMYYAEKKLAKTLPRMAKKATMPDLIEAFISHAAETENHAARIEHIFKMRDKAARGRKCEALEGLSAESEHVMKKAEEVSVLNAGLTAAARAMEHYEIARYRTLIAWAKELGMTEAMEMLAATLSEEIAADGKLGEIARELNPVAERADAA
ncbi:MAG: ferritin-like domain-containing protein [Pseudomonadota bacterium]